MGFRVRRNFIKYAGKRCGDPPIPQRLSRRRIHYRPRCVKSTRLLVRHNIPRPQSLAASLTQRRQRPAVSDATAEIDQWETQRTPSDIWRRGNGTISRASNCYAPDVPTRQTDLLQGTPRSPRVDPIEKSLDPPGQIDRLRPAPHSD